MVYWRILYYVMQCSVQTGVFLMFVCSEMLHKIILQLSTYICGNELLHIIDALDSDFTLADHWIVVRVGGDEQGLCKELKCSMLPVLSNIEISENTIL